MSKIPGSAHLNFSFGGLAILGGAAGYFRKGSTVSLIAGLTCGSLLLGSGYMICNDREHHGHMLAAGTSGFMAIGMGQRFLKTSKFMPAGLVASLSVAAAAYNFKKGREWAPSKGD
mmetsp:Transcript_27061/g.39985  ORF Transcript_27061/g.39985 Transcript_27061/m.39985 type:complete len:116 (-) Transcript_27061:49-396(-)|eukprot:CAMPEP_0194212734 /NCGR_PEP_ID=MMETSP0156-20130528/12783_1 /TAXON_ID=33649 /ORGANISM="Thalassionema nitzschioides, Strain L26-B" /LENGTH=115 /DNA_ID=CAMNT_0038940611 /DNA_START=54 /DNA_END=401 /DNA_ORIENTATION=+